MLTPIRLSILALAVLCAFAACGGHGIVPPGGSPAGGFNMVAPDMFPGSTNPCYSAKVQPTWIFKGACKIATLPAKGTTIKLPAYKGVTVTASLPPNNDTGKKFVVVDALDKNKDVLPWKGKAFPKFKSATQTTLIYVQSINDSRKSIKFKSGSLDFKIGAKSFPGKTCFLAYLNKKFKWTGTPFQSPVKRGAVKFAIPSSLFSALFPNGLLPGPLFINVSCK